MNIKYMNIKEFREKGYLQELNRQFLHPLGLALEIKIDDNGNETLGGIWDYRDHDEGIYYNIKESPLTRRREFKTKSKFIQKELATRNINRRNILGFDIEPVE